MRSALTIIGISIGVASVIMIGNISECGTSAVNNELDSLGMGGLSITANTTPSLTTKLTDSELELVKKAEFVTQATPIIMQRTEVLCKNNKLDTMVWGIDAKANQVISLQVLFGRSISNIDVKSSAKVCMVDQTFAKNSYNRDNIVGKKLSILCNGSSEEYEIVGVIKTGSGLLQNLIGDYIPNFIYIPYTSMEKATGITSFDQIAVRLEGSCDPDKAGENIISTLDRANGTSQGYTSSNLIKQKEGLKNVLNIVTVVLSAVGAISLLVASLSIMTVMLVSVNERTREIGIKKSIGARRKTILFEFLLEAVFISLIGCFIGVLFGSAISYIGAYFIGISVKFRGDIMLVAIVFSLLTGIIFGVYPAAKASNLRPVDALRLE